MVSISNERLRTLSPERASAFEFVDIDGFYDASKNQEDLEEEDIAIIKGIFTEHRIKFKTLCRLTDEKLKDSGILKLGLREAMNINCII